MALTAIQVLDGARQFANDIYVVPNATANFSLVELQAALQSIDTAMNATLNQAVAAQGGTTTLVNALIGNFPEPFKSVSTTQQKALVLIYWAKKAAGL